MKTLSITHSIIYHYQKEKNSFFCEVKVTENPEAPKGPLTDGVLFRFHFDRMFLRFLSGWVLLRVLSDSVFSNRFFSRVISALFPACRYFLIKTCYYFFVIKNRCSVLDHFSKKKFTLNN